MRHARRRRSARPFVHKPVAIAVGALLVLAASAGAAFTASGSNPQNTFSAANNFCAAPGEQVVLANRDISLDSLLGGSGSANRLNVGPGTLLGLLGRRRALVGFDLPPFPDRCVLTGAVLELYASNPTNGRTIQVYRAANSWTEGSATWSDMTGVGSPTSASSGSSAGWRSWSVKDQVQAQYDSGNHSGFVIMDANDAQLLSLGVTQEYHSREAANDPRLRLTFD